MSTATDVRLLGCLDCGKCTGTCPIARENGGLSPRRIVRKAMKGDVAAAVKAARECLTCRLCDVRCPAGVPYIETVRKLRGEVGPSTRPDDACHCGVFSTITKMQTTPGLKPRRMDWLADDVEIDPESETLLWIGCSPFFAAYFADWGEEIKGTANNAIRVLNRLGIKPAVSDEERCCGHDALWTGDLDSFRKLAEINLEWLARSPAKRILFLCPSCALAFREEIPERVGSVDKELTTLAEFLAENLDGVAVNGKSMTVTYHDPCRMGRHQGHYDEPRAVIDALPGVELREMEHNRESATCCGGGNWAHCDGTTRRIQHKRIEEAIDTGAEALVSTCPRCLIHLRCALESEGGDGKTELPLMDLGTLVAQMLPEEK